MQWLAVGHDGQAFAAQAERAPGWYWIYRPLNTGPRAFDPRRGVVLPVLVRADGTVQSPLTDLQGMGLDDLVPPDDGAGVRYQSYFAGPIAPGPRSGQLEALPGQAPTGQPPGPGWWWCRTQAPLAHVDADGIGPIFVADRAGQPWVYPAAFADGAPADVFELGFAEPLVSDGGIIDASGEVGRHRAELFGPIAPHPDLPPRFAVVGLG